MLFVFLWPTLSGIILLRSIHVIANGRTFFPPWLSSVLPHTHTVSTHPSTSGHQAASVFWAPKQHLCEHGVQTSSRDSDPASFSQALDHMAPLSLILWGSLLLSSEVAVPTHIPTSGAQGLPSPPALGVSQLPDNGHSSRYEVPLTMALICTSLMPSSVEHPSMHLPAPWMSSLEKGPFGIGWLLGS